MTKQSSKFFVSQRLGETSLVKTPTHRKDFWRPVKNNIVVWVPEKNMWPKFQGRHSSWVPMFSVVKVEHQLKS